MPQRSRGHPPRLTHFPSYIWWLLYDNLHSQHVWGTAASLHLLKVQLHSISFWRGFQQNLLEVPLPSSRYDLQYVILSLWLLAVVVCVCVCFITWGCGLQRNTVILKLKINPFLLPESLPPSSPSFLLPSLFPSHLPFMESCGWLHPMNGDTVMNKAQTVPALMELTAESRGGRNQIVKEEEMGSCYSECKSQVRTMIEF